MDLRNIIAHEYFHIDAEEIFDTVQNDVQPLLQWFVKNLSGYSSVVQ